MKIHYSLDDLSDLRSSVLTIGIFDGVHIGHQQVIAYLNKQATKINGESVLLTFDPHPKIVLNPDNHQVQLIQTSEEKFQKLQKYGIQHIVVLEFTHELSQLSADDFLQTILLDRLKMKQIVIGHDHHFGRNRAGNIHFLQRKAPELGFSVIEIPPKTIDDTTISSTKIREALKKGEMEVANKFLGHPFSISGDVVKGRQLGRQLGFPTANLQVNNDLKLIPQDGIYIVKSITDTTNPKIGILSIGTNPTTTNSTKRTIEVFFLDFSDNLYGEKIGIELLHFIRPTEKFNSTEALIQQMKRDEQYTRNYMEK